MGPKPTKLQLEMLTRLAQPGVCVHEWSQIRGSLRASIVIPSTDPNKSDRHETLRHDVLEKFHRWGWLKAVGDHSYSWQSHNFVITDEGREVVAKGEVRK
jgi:hypothetical protein